MNPALENRGFAHDGSKHKSLSSFGKSIWQEEKILSVSPIPSTDSDQIGGYVFSNLKKKKNLFF